MNSEKSVTKECLTPVFFILQVFLKLKTDMKQYCWGKQVGLCKSSGLEPTGMMFLNSFLPLLKVCTF